MDAFTSFVVCFVVTFALLQVVFYFLNKRADKRLAKLRAEVEAANKRRDQAIIDAANEVAERIQDARIKSDARANTRASYVLPQGARGPQVARGPQGERVTGVPPEMAAPYGTPARQETTQDDTAAMLLTSAAFFSSPAADDTPAPSFSGGGGTFDGGGASGDWGSSSSDSSSSSSYSSSDSSSSSSSDSGSSSCGSD